MSTRKRTLSLLILIIVLALLLKGCQANVETAPQEATAVTPLPEATGLAPIATAEPDMETERMTVAGLSLACPSELASAVTHEAVAALEGEGPESRWSLPAHDVFHLQGYPPAGSLHQPHIAIYPATRYQEMNEQAAVEMSALEKLLATRPEEFDEALPLLPVANARQLFHAQERYLSFAGGDGIRYLAFYAQDAFPVNNEGLFYTFQGLTHDGVYYVSAVFPVHTGTLPDSVRFGDFDYEALSADYEAHAAEVAALLNPLEGSAFTPDLSALDALVQSLDLGNLPAVDSGGDEGMATSPAVPADSAEVTAGPATLAEASVALDTASPLVESVTVETVPASELLPDPAPRFLARPAHTILHLAGYPVSHSYLETQISIFPVEAYTGLGLPAEEQVEHLQALLAAWPHPDPMAGETAFPYLPEPNAVQILRARPAHLAFKNGEGIRYLTQYVQDVAPVTSGSLFYTFQGLTGDGQFYLSAVLPIDCDALPQDIPEAQAQGFDSFTYNFDRVGYEDYLAEQQAQIDSLDNDSFSPDLAALDALVQSLDLSGYRGPALALWEPDVALAPDQVLDDFLEEYVPSGGFPAGVHQDNAALQPEFVAEVEATIAAYQSQGIEASGYDPVLMTHAGPTGFGFERMEIGRAVIEGEVASVLVERHWHYTHAVSPLRFTFNWSGEQWQITGVSSNVASIPVAPEQVAEQLFAMMVASAGQFTGPAEWLRRVDPAVVVANGTVDICDQSWPVGMAIEGSFVQPAPLHLSSNVEEEATVVVYLPFTGGLLTTRLVQQGGAWQVSDVVCGETPLGRALAFYTWYLGEAANAGETRWAERVPGIDAMNPGHFFVTERFLRQASLRFQEDPYLPPGRVPDRFLVESGAGEDIVVVHLEYYEEEQVQVTTLLLTFQQEGGVWLIDNVEIVTAE